MSFNTQTFRIKAQLEASASATISNIALPVTPGDEFSLALEAGVKKLMVKTRGNSMLQLAYNSGDSGLKYITIPGAGVYVEDKLLLSGVTLYMQSPSTSDIVEILQWT